MEKFGFHKVSNNTGAGNATISHSQPGPGFHRKQLKAANSPANPIVLSNKVAVHPQDFPEVPDGTNVLLDGFVVYQILKTDQIQRGMIGMGADMRTWGKWSLQQTVIVEPFYLGNKSYLGSIDLSINFRSKSKATTEPISHDDLITQFLQVYGNQVLQPTQPMIMDFQGKLFLLSVLSVKAIDIGNKNLADVQDSTSIKTKGILIKDTFVNFYPAENSVVNLVKAANSKTRSANRPRATPIINPDFKLEDLGIGGLDKEFGQIFRRAFASRVISPDLVTKLGLRHVKGLLLFGPPGTGKTLIARQIGKMLNVREPKIVNGPEMLSKFVGASEENIRNLFKDAEAEYKQKGENSQLHMIIFDELDSVFKQRGGSKSDGTGVGDNVVNQLLAKMDGVDQLNNILIVGMTNRLDLIDNALLRPGRFEVQIEISLPDEKGRNEILGIHTKSMRENNLLAQDVDLAELAALTKNFTGAELEGLCNSASSFAINVFTKNGGAQIDDNISKMKVTRNDFMLALGEVKPAFGVNEEDLTQYAPRGIIEYSPSISHAFAKCQSLIDQIQVSETDRLLSTVLYGPPGSGKTALATTLALNSDFPFVKILSPSTLVGMSDQQQISTIGSIFRDVHRSPLSVLVIDNIEAIIKYNPIGPRFSMDILSELVKNMIAEPPKGRKLLIIATTSEFTSLKHMKVFDSFSKFVAISNISSLKDLNSVMEKFNFMDASGRHAIIQEIGSVFDTSDEGKSSGNSLSIGIKRLLQILQNSKTAKAGVDAVVEDIVEAHVMS